MKASGLISLLGVVMSILPVTALAAENSSSVAASSAGGGLRGKAWSLRPEVGISELSYNQENARPMSSAYRQSIKSSEMAVTARVAYLQELPESDWRLGANASMDFVTSAYNNQPDFRTLGADVSFQNDLVFIDPSFSLGIVAGAYYRTMYSSTKDFGYKNLIGPQLYPTATKVLSNGNRVSGYLKFSPLNHLFSITDHEIGAGVAYTFPINHLGNDLRVSVDYARRHLIVEGAQFNDSAYESEVSNSAATLAVSYGL